MKYKIEEHPNLERLTIHLTKKLTDKSYDEITDIGDIIYMKHENRVPGSVMELVSVLLEIPGVTELALYKYSLSFEKGKAFDWDTITKQIVHEINLFLVKDNESMSELKREIVTDEDREKLKRQMDRDNDMFGY